MSVTVVKATDKRLTTIAAVKAELQVGSGTDDAYLASGIAQASDAIAVWCDRSFGLETVREYLDHRYAVPSVLLSRWPLVEVKSSSADGMAFVVSGTEVDEIDGSVYRLDAGGKRIAWPSGSVIIEYSAGYVLPNQTGRTLPHDIERAALTLIKAHWYARNRDPLIRSETSEGIGSTDYFAGTISQLPPEVESLLPPYRNLTFG
jgi:hypothetical protein